MTSSYDRFVSHAARHHDFPLGTVVRLTHDAHPCPAHAPLAEYGVGTVVTRSNAGFAGLVYSVRVASAQLASVYATTLVPAEEACSTCGGDVDEPHRRRTAAGIIAEGCIDGCHNGYLTGADLAWHQRPEAAAWRGRPAEVELEAVCDICDRPQDDHEEVMVEGCHGDEYPAWECPSDEDELDDQDRAEMRLMARDYEAWASL